MTIDCCVLGASANENIWSTLNCQETTSKLAHVLRAEESPTYHQGGRKRLQLTEMHNQDLPVGLASMSESCTCSCC